MGSWSHDCSSSAGLLDSYPALVLYLAGVALHQQPMGSRSHDCSSYVGCGGIPCSILVSPNASLHKWQQAVAPGWLPYMVPQNWIQARTEIVRVKTKTVLSKYSLPRQRTVTALTGSIHRSELASFLSLWFTDIFSCQHTWECLCTIS